MTPARIPYLLVGAVLALGLEGIDRALRLPPEVTVDPATLSEDELASHGAALLPRSLEDALEPFRGSDALAEAMGAPLFGTIIAVREAEVAQFAGRRGGGDRVRRRAFATDR